MNSGSTNRRAKTWMTKMKVETGCRLHVMSRVPKLGTRALYTGSRIHFLPSTEGVISEPELTLVSSLQEKWPLAGIVGLRSARPVTQALRSHRRIYPEPNWAVGPYNMCCSGMSIDTRLYVSSNQHLLHPHKNVEHRVLDAACANLIRHRRKAWILPCAM